MKTLKLSAVFLCAAVLATAAVAQDKATPAAAPATTIVKAPAAQPVAAVAINGYVYVEKLPTPPQLMSEAEAEHLAITRMDQSADRVVVVYQYPNGQTRAFAYTTSAPTAEEPAPVGTTQSAAAATYTVVSAPPPPPTTVVYAEPETRVVYYESPRYVRYYDPAWDFWAPLAVGVGLGWTFGGHGHGHSYGGYHGGFHGHGGHR